MKIKELIIENFKGFNGRHTFDFDKNFNFFVGDNNSGKSTVFEAIEFLRSGLPTGKNIDAIKNKSAKEHVRVTIKLQEGINNAINDFSQKKYENYVFDEKGIETMLASRSSETTKITQGGKEVELTIKKITLWNPKTKQFENPAGLDTVFKTLFETQIVWADTQSDEISDFGSTKICGRLLTGVIGNFFESTQWKAFIDVHEQTFHKGADSLTNRTKVLETQLHNIINSQYGDTGVSFQFQLPDVTSFIKSGQINLDDGTETSSKEKGTGMQRTLALALIQVYAEQICKHPTDPTKKKPLFLFIDEPETFLHPLAQNKLLSALDTIASIQQIFISTHSPFLLKSFNKSNHSLFMFSKSKTTNLATPSTVLGLFGKSSPTWGEIIYYAYKMNSTEFHNELFGFIQAKAIEQDDKCCYENNFDKFLNIQGLPINFTWIKETKAGDKPVQVTLSTFIRNTIHHPENTKNPKYTDEQLNESTEKLIDILNKI